MKFELFDEKKKSPIYYIIRKQKNGHRIFLKYPVGISLSPEDWNKNKQRVREVYGIPYLKHNKLLSQIHSAAENIFLQYELQELTSDIVRQKIDFAIKRPGSKAPGSTFDEYINYYIQTNQDKRGYQNIKSYITLQKKLPKGLGWHSFTYQFYERFVNKLESAGLSKNYVGRMVNNLKIILSSAHKSGINPNTEFKSWKVLKEQVYNIYLSEKELEILYNYPFTGHLEKARDLFLIGCYTGMRVENYLNIDPEINIINGRITAIVNKGGPRISIPVHWMIREILGKYNGFPKSISQQKLNKYIKDACQIAGINDKIITVKTQGGKRAETVRFKYQMVSSHTARRSMATNCYLRGIPVDYIMNILGHTSPAQTIAYIKTGLDEISDRVAELDFWDKPVGQNIGAK